ncbi:Cytochrome P450 superfamily protein [Pleurotus pulmonarius]
MPWAGFKAYAERVRPFTIDMREAPYKEGASRLRGGEGEPSILSRSMGRHDVDSHPDEELLKDVTWVAYTGGAETSPLVISTFVAAMVLYPEVQKKGQEELDGYLGARLPVFEDLAHLPYVRAIMLEVLRCVAPVFPFGYLSSSLFPLRHYCYLHRLHYLLAPAFLPRILQKLFSSRIQLGPCLETQPLALFRRYWFLSLIE